jgi:hypothetical protein
MYRDERQWRDIRRRILEKGTPKSGSPPTLGLAGKQSTRCSRTSTLQATALGGKATGIALTAVVTAAALYDKRDMTSEAFESVIAAY